MIARPRIASILLLLATAIGLAGCDNGSRTDDGGEAFVLGDMIEPFDPPTLEELDAMVEWEERPVLDSMELMRARQAEEPKLATVEEALAMRNDGPEANATILSALGRLPADETEVDYDAVFVRHSAADVKSTNPLMGSSTTEFDVAGLTSFGLVGFDWKFRPFGSKDTVKSWHSSKDRLYDKIVIRDDLTWSDGRPITAHDVEFSFKAIMSEKVPTPSQRSGTDKLKWVKAYDDQTVVFFHQKSLATNLWNIGFAVLPKHIYEKSIYDDPTLQDSDHHVQYEQNPVTGGVYEFAERVQGKEIVLRRRESWYMHDGKQVRDKPHFKEVRFRIILEPSVALLALKAGDIDEKILTPEEWQTKTGGDDFYKNNTKVFGVEWTYFYFGWNLETPYFSDVRVRKAMSYAFDHDEMLGKLRYGLDQACNGIYHPTSQWAPKDPPAPYKRDVDKAEQLLAEAGWADHDGDGILDKEIDGRSVKFEFSMLCMNRPERIAICNLLKENLERIGVVCNVRPLEFTVLQEKTRTHEFHAHFGGWGSGAYPDTSENLWKTGADRNFVQYSNPEVDKLLDAALVELDDAKRQEMFGRLHTILYEDQPYTWLFTRTAFFGFNRQLRGYNFSPRGPYSYGPGEGSIFKPAMQ